MEIFELMDDTDKVIQVLINLANLAELQLDSPGDALEYRYGIHIHAHTRMPVTSFKRMCLCGTQGCWDGERWLVWWLPS